MHSPSPGEAGAVTAEWAVALPALVVVAALLTGGLGAGVAQYRLHQYASDHARVIGLGGDARALPWASDSREWRVSHSEDLVCVHYSEFFDTGWWALSPLALQSEACTLDTWHTRVD